MSNDNVKNGCGGGCTDCAEKREQALHDPRFAAAHYGYDLFVPSGVTPLPTLEELTAVRTLPTLRVKRLRPEAQLPKYATDGAACFDLVASDDGHPHPNDVNAWIFPTGLAFEVPAGQVMLVFSRSGHGFKDAIRLSNCVGVIDSDYRGEVLVSLRADGGQGRRLCAGDRVAQAMLVPVQQWGLVEVDELSNTARGAGGFGSTGA